MSGNPTDQPKRDGECPSCREILGSGPYECGECNAKRDCNASEMIRQRDEWIEKAVSRDNRIAELERNLTIADGNSLAGKRVTIKWSDDDLEWTEFTVLHDNGTHLRLRGEPMDGDAHDGVPFWAAWREIVEIVEHPNL